MKKLTMLVAAAFAMTSAMAQLNPMEPIPADKDVRTGKLENGMTYYIRHNERTGGFPHPARRGSHPGERRTAGPRPLPRAHGLQRHEKPPRQADDRIPGEGRREIRRQPQRRHQLGHDFVHDEGRPDLTRGHHRQCAADPARLVALHRPPARGDRLGARRDHGGAPHPRQRFVAFDHEDAPGAGQGHEIRAPQPDRLSRRAERLPAQGTGGFLQHVVPPRLSGGRDRG